MKQRKALSNDRYQEIRQALAMGPTPGPWVAGKNSMAVNFRFVTDKDGDVIAYCDKSKGEAKANASFIAACEPDTAQALLEERDALRDALKELITWIPSADIYLRLGFDPKAPMRALREAKEALAKGGAA